MKFIAAFIETRMNAFLTQSSVFQISYLLAPSNCPKCWRFKVVWLTVSWSSKHIQIIGLVSVRLPKIRYFNIYFRALDFEALRNYLNSIFLFADIRAQFHTSYKFRHFTVLETRTATAKNLWQWKLRAVAPKQSLAISSVKETICSAFLAHFLTYYWISPP